MWSIFFRLFQVVFWTPSTLTIHGLVLFGHVILDCGIRMWSIIPCVDSDPLSIVIDFHSVRTIRNTSLFSNVTVRNRVIMPVFNQQHVIMFLHFCFGIMPDLIRGFGKWLQVCLFLFIEQLLSTEHFLLKVQLVVGIQFYPNGSVKFRQTMSRLVT